MSYRESRFFISFATYLASRNTYPSDTKVVHLTTGEKLTFSFCSYLLLKTWSSLSWSWSQLGARTGVAGAPGGRAMLCRGESLSTLFISKTTLSKGFIEFNGVFRRCIALGATRIGTMDHEMHLARNGVWRGQLHQLWDGPLTWHECLNHI